MLFVDTNIFLRLFLEDHPRQSAKAKMLFDQARKGQTHLWTSTWVIAEIVWILESFYKKPRPFIVEVIRRMFGLPGLTIDHGEMLIEALTLYLEKNIDFIDAVNGLLVRDRGEKAVYSYDKDFDRLDWVDRREP